MGRDKTLKPQAHHVFSVGDICAAQDNSLYVITDVGEHSYKFINLQEKVIRVVDGIINIRKGTISEQPFSIFDKYHYLYQPKF